MPSLKKVQLVYLTLRFKLSDRPASNRSPASACDILYQRKKYKFTVSPPSSHAATSISGCCRGDPEGRSGCSMCVLNTKITFRSNLNRKFELCYSALNLFKRSFLRHYSNIKYFGKLLVFAVVFSCYSRFCS